MARRAGSPASTKTRVPQLLLFGLWVVVVIWLAVHHAMWRDEVRALSFALHGDSVVQMLRFLHGDGHPALWHLLLRASHALAPTALVLPVLAALIAASSAALLLFASPLRWPWLALMLFGNFFLYEYTVMARNYGISMLLLFIIAVFWQRGYRGLGFGGLLLLLANCNVHSVVLAGAFMLFWMLEIWRSDGLAWTIQWRTWLGSAVIAGVGVILCLLTVYPTFNDAAAQSGHPALSVAAFAKAILLPASTFPDLILSESLRGQIPPLAWELPGSLILFGSLLVFAARPSLLAAGLAALLMLSLLFRFVYPADYRHAALWLVLMITLLWLDRVSPSEWRLPAAIAHLAQRARTVGAVLLALLFALQWPQSAQQMASVIRHVPASRSADLGVLVRQHPGFASSWIIADPDYLVEPVPYYLSNPVWRMREQREGPVVIFTSQAKLRLTLDDILSNARALRQQSAKPVLILLSTRVSATTSGSFKEGYNWTLDVTPPAAERFLRETRRLASFGPAVSDETFDVYSFE